MAEAIHCPSCSTRYRLRVERLHPALRRARCLNCTSVFPIWELVARLLPPPAESDSPSATGRFSPAEVAASLAEPVSPPSLTLGDLEGADAEILEKTLVDVPLVLPEAKADLPAAEAVPPFPPELTEATLSGYTSARDAIDKLFGDTPAQPKGLQVAKDSSDMDMEATLSALEATLGGPAASTAPEADLAGDNPTDAGRLSKEVEAATTTTLRLSQADMAAALAAAPSAGVRMEPLPKPPRPSVEVISTPMAPDAGAELLRLKIGEEIYPGLTMAQLIAWVEEGRVLETHVVARQHSENWLEAQKVPGLRPIFERLRRERSQSSPTFDSPSMEIAPKKSLFGGLFGKN